LTNPRPKLRRGGGLRKITCCNEVLLRRRDFALPSMTLVLLQDKGCKKYQEIGSVSDSDPGF
jgi:hypothetical protein